jgi:transcriptional regulator with XRE-family HTH domain
VVDATRSTKRKEYYMVHESLAQRLRVLRAKKGWTLVEAARHAGVGRDTLSDLERGRQHPVMPTVAKLAKGYGVPVEELLEEPVLAGKAEAPETGPEETFEEMMARERRGGMTDADIIKQYEGITRGYRLSWRGTLERLATQWEERLRTGVFTLGMVEQFFADMIAVSQGVSQALYMSHNESMLQLKYRTAWTAEDVEESSSTGIGDAAADIIELSDRLYAAAAKRFSHDELAEIRRKREEAKRALGRAA